MGMEKSSAFIPAALAGGVFGGLASGGSAQFSGDPYADTRGAALRGAGLGAVAAGGAYGLSRLPSWAVLPATMVGVAGYLSSKQEEPSGPQIPSIRSMRRN